MSSCAVNFACTMSSLDDLRKRQLDERKSLELSNQKAIQAAEKKGKPAKVKATTAAAVAMAELDERHEKEEADWKQQQQSKQPSSATASTTITSASGTSTTSNAAADQLTNQLVSMSISPSSTSNVSATTATFSAADDNPKISKAQKKRLAKENAERERLVKIEEAKKNVVDPAVTENNILQAQLSKYGLTIKEIAPDGNCLYSSIIDQLASRSIATSVAVRDQRHLRELIAEYMLKHRDDYAPFIDETDVESGAANDGQQHDSFKVYCDRIATTSNWGGQLEMRAAANLLDCSIRIHSAKADPTTMGGNATRVLDLSYHRAAYALGEHYNSLRPSPTN